MPPVSGFLGRYDFQMDEKGRVSLPAAFRKEAEGDRFILLQWEEPYLTLFPESVWKEVQERLLEYRRKDSTSWTYVREITSKAVELIVPAGTIEDVGPVIAAQEVRPEAARHVLDTDERGLDAARTLREPDCEIGYYACPIAIQSNNIDP